MATEIIGKYGDLEWPIRYRKDPSTVFKDPDDQEFFEGGAVAFLWNLTGQQFGTTEHEVRPCGAPCYQGSRPLNYGPVYGTRAGRMFCGSCNESCACNELYSLKLPGPIDSIEKITIDGEEQDEGTYRHNRSRVYSYEPWPVCQNLALPATEEDTFEITYKRGVEVPPQGQLAAGLLAIEFFKGANNDASCKLPQRLTSLTRQGVSMDIMDGFEDIEKGITGIWLVDSWVVSVTRPTTPARVYSPDIARKVAP